MSNATRKARKREGEHFVRVPKTATPLFERSLFALVFDAKRGWHESAKARRARAERSGR